MTFAELNTVPRTRGRASAPLALDYVRDLQASDLALLASERGIAPPTISRLRERHHALARCLASGMSNAEASAITGYDPSRISILRGDPTFKALLEDYGKIENAYQAEFVERATVLGLTAINNLQEQLEDDASPLPASMTLEIAKFAADRTGHAPVSKNIQINANVNMGSRLSEARKRLALAAQVEVVSSEPVSEDPGPDATQ